MSDPGEYDPDERFSLFPVDPERVLEKLLGTEREDENEPPEGGDS